MKTKKGFVMITKVEEINKEHCLIIITRKSNETVLLSKRLYL